MSPTSLQVTQGGINGSLPPHIILMITLWDDLGWEAVSGPRSLSECYSNGPNFTAQILKCKVFCMQKHAPLELFCSDVADVFKNCYTLSEFQCAPSPLVLWVFHHCPSPQTSSQRAVWCFCVMNYWPRAQFCFFLYSLLGLICGRCDNKIRMTSVSPKVQLIVNPEFSLIVWKKNICQTPPEFTPQLWSPLSPSSWGKAVWLHRCSLFASTVN